MTKKELKENILSLLDGEELRTADLVRALIQKASPLTIGRHVKALESDGKIVLNQNKKWRIKE